MVADGISFAPRIPSVGTQGVEASDDGGCSQSGDQVVHSLQYGVREGGDGDEVLVDSEVLFRFLDEQSRSLRDFLRSARER